MKARPQFWVALGLAIFFFGVVKVSNAKSRGIRNNNPGNIRLSATKWAGQVEPAQQTDSAFVQFTDPVYGIRAMTRILKSYASRGVTTLAQIVSTWAPATENDTQAYIASVSKATGLTPGSRVSEADYPALLAAIIRHENGSQPYTPAQIAKGISLA